MALGPDQWTWLKAFAALATPICQEYGVPVTVCVAQAALESGWGRYAIGFNVFGMKGKGDAGQTKAMTAEWTGDVATGGYSASVQGFARYSGTAAAVRAWAGRVTSGVYSGSRAYGGDPVAFATWIWASGYATAPDYVGRVLGTAGTAARALGWPEPYPQPRADVQQAVARLAAVPSGSKRRSLRDELMPAGAAEGRRQGARSLGWAVVAVVVAVGAWLRLRR